MTKSKINSYIAEYQIHDSFELKEILSRMENSLKNTTDVKSAADLRHRMAAITYLIEREKRRIRERGYRAR